MKIKIYKITFLLLGLVLSACSVMRKEKVVFRLERQKLLSQEFEILPFPFYIQKDNYEEGVIYFFSFADGAYIVVFQGSMMEFSMDQYPVQEKGTKNQRNISVGVRNDKFWRKDTLEDNIRIYYDNVSTGNKELYDKVLDEMKFFPIK